MTDGVKAMIDNGYINNDKDKLGGKGTDWHHIASCVNKW